MKTLSVSVNQTAKVRRVTVAGRNFLVADSTLIIPGVLAGSNGPLYYPPDEISKDPQRWNGVPLTLGHPRSPDGYPVSGRTPEVLNTHQLGNVYRARWDGKALRAEAWFDEELTKKNGPDVHANLLKGQVTELSTGLFTDDEPVSNGKDPISGKEYTHVARNYRPDHLAVLVGVKGACSVADGCGVLVNARYSFDSEKCPGCGAAMEGDPDTGKCNRCGKRYGKLAGKETVNAFCPTGEGGGVDPSCSPGSGDKGSVKSLKFKGVSNKPAAGMSASQINKELDSIDEHSSKITDEFISTGRGHETPREYLSPDKTDDLSARAQALHKRRQELTIERDLRTGGGMSRLPKGFGPRKLNYARRFLRYALNALLGRQSRPYGDQPHSSDTGRFKTPGAGTGKSDTRDHALLGATELTDQDITLGSAAAVYGATTGTPGAKPPWASDAAKWHRATALAAKGGDPPTSHRYYAVTVHIYRGLGGGFDTSPSANAFCPTGEGGGVDPSCSPGGTGKSSGAGPKPATPQNVRKVFESVGASMSTTKTGTVAQSGTKVGTYGKIITEGFKFGKGLNEGEVEVSYRPGGIYSKSKSDQSEKVATAAKARLKEMGYETLDFTSTTFTVRTPKPIPETPTGNVGLDMTPDKACKILKDGSVHGRPLTERQRGMFGARCGLRKKGKSKDGGKKAKRNQPAVVNQSSEDTEMATKAENVKTLTTNCECWRGRDKVLEAMDERLVADLVKQNSDAEELNLVVNELREEFGAEEGEVALNAMPAFIKKKVKAKDAEPDDDDATDDDDDDKDETYKKNQRGGTTVVNKESVLAVLNSLSQDELLALPGMAGIRERDQLSQQILTNQKSQLVDRLTENVTDPAKKKARREKLGKLSLNELMDRVEDLPAPARSASGSTSAPAPTFYLGAGPTGNSGHDDEFKPKPMLMPKINWAEEKKLLDAGASNRAG